MLFMDTVKISESLSASSKTLFASFITCSRSHVRRIRPKHRVWSVASSHLSPETFSRAVFVPFRVRLVRQVWEVGRVVVSSPLQRDDVTLGVIWATRHQPTEQWLCTPVWWAALVSLFHGSVLWFSVCSVSTTPPSTPPCSPLCTFSSHLRSCHLLSY